MKSVPQSSMRWSCVVHWPSGDCSKLRDAQEDYQAIQADHHQEHPRAADEPEEEAARCVEARSPLISAEDFQRDLLVHRAGAKFAVQQLGER